jgi:hypothetical protein
MVKIPLMRRTNHEMKRKKLLTAEENHAQIQRRSILGLTKQQLVSFLESSFLLFLPVTSVIYTIKAIRKQLTLW